MDDLIHRRSRRIYLNSDIVLDKDEIPDYHHGIKIDRDNIK
ncbi:hypothetical protein [Methanobrevibacter millerae]|nr:hypothetical protein [Methanobrevibacter millerae]